MATTKPEIKQTVPMINVSYLAELLQNKDDVSSADLQRLKKLLTENKGKSEIPQIDVILCFEDNLWGLHSSDFPKADFTQTTARDEKMTPADWRQNDQFIFAQIIHYCNETTWKTKNLFPCIILMRSEDLLNSQCYQALAQSPQRFSLYAALQSAPP